MCKVFEELFEKQTAASHFEDISLVFGNVIELSKYNAFEKSSCPRRVILPLGNKVPKRLRLTLTLALI
jgi:hypothetical protein